MSYSIGINIDILMEIEARTNIVLEECSIKQVEIIRVIYIYFVLIAFHINDIHSSRSLIKIRKKDFFCHSFLSTKR